MSATQKQSTKVVTQVVDHELTAMEERVVRMRTGKSVPLDEPLEFVLPESAPALDAVLRMEAQLMKTYRAYLASKKTVSTGTEAKIVAALKKAQ